MPSDFASVSAPAVTAPLFTGAALLDAEKLDCYRLAVEFQAVAAGLLPKRGASSLRDQLDRASTSIVLNIAEGGATSEGWRIQWERVPPGQEPEAPVAWMADRSESE